MDMKFRGLIEPTRITKIEVCAHNVPVGVCDFHCVMMKIPYAGDVISLV